MIENEKRSEIAGALIIIAGHIKRGLNITDIQIDYEKGMIDFKAIFPAFPEEIKINWNRGEAERFEAFMKEQEAAE